MDENRAGGYVNKLIFNNDYELNINCNDIVVFVGPNNVGKSRALRDISTISAQPFPGIIIMSAIFHKNVVLCEIDSDCKMYSLVDEALK